MQQTNRKIDKQNKCKNRQTNELMYMHALAPGQPKHFY